MTARVVAVVHTEDGLCTGVVAHMDNEWPAAEYHLTTRRYAFSYADVLRKLWRRPECDLVIVEQDVIPPVDALHNLFECENRWCTHPHWTGEHHQLDSLGLVKFSWQLRESLPMLADVVCCNPDVRYWVRRGWTNMPKDCSVAQLNSAGKRAAITQHGDLFQGNTPPDWWPTTHDWMGLDTDLSRALRAAGHTPCVHEWPTVHLHDYEAAPKDNHMPWHQRPYLASEWAELP